MIYLVCGTLAHPEISGTGYDDGDGPSCSCLRKDDHDGPHLIQRTDGTYWAFELNLECDCEGCQSEDSADWCEFYWEITSAHELQDLLYGNLKKSQV